MQTDRQIYELILQKLERLELSHLNLERKVEEIHKNTKQMEEHINFIEKTYEKVKTPFHYLMEKISLLSFSSYKRSEILQKDS